MRDDGPHLINPVSDSCAILVASDSVSLRRALRAHKSPDGAVGEDSPPGRYLRGSDGLGIGVDLALAGYFADFGRADCGNESHGDPRRQ